MKRFLSVFSLLLILSMALSACGGNTITVNTSDNTEKVPAYSAKLRITVLNGATGFGMAPMYRDMLTDETSGAFRLIETCDFLDDPSLVSSRLISKDADIAAVPTNLAANLYQKTNGGIQVLGINTLGVLYLLETKHYTQKVYSLQDLQGKAVSLPGRGTNPEYVINAILNKNGLQGKVIFDISSASPDALSAAVLADRAELALLPEPKISVTQYKYLDNNRSLNHYYQSTVVLDISKEWKEAFGCDLVQGCFVVRKEFADAHPDVIKAFAEEYQKSNALSADEKIDAVLDVGLIPDNLFAVPTEYTELSAEAYQRESYRGMLERCNLVAQFGEEIKEPLMTYWRTLYDVSPNSIGGKLPDEGIFRIVR